MHQHGVDACTLAAHNSPPLNAYIRRVTVDVATPSHRQAERQRPRAKGDPRTAAENRRRIRRRTVRLYRPELICNLAPAWTYMYGRRPKDAERMCPHPWQGAGGRRVKRSQSHRHRDSGSGRACGGLGLKRSYYRWHPRFAERGDEGSAPPPLGDVKRRIALVDKRYGASCSAPGTYSGRLRVRETKDRLHEGEAENTRKKKNEIKSKGAHKPSHKKAERGMLLEGSNRCDGFSSIYDFEVDRLYQRHLGYTDLEPVVRTSERGVRVQNVESRELERVAAMMRKGLRLREDENATGDDYDDDDELVWSQARERVRMGQIRREEQPYSIRWIEERRGRKPKGQDGSMNAMTDSFSVVDDEACKDGESAWEDVDWDELDADVRTRAEGLDDDVEPWSLV